MALPGGRPHELDFSFTHIPPSWPPTRESALQFSDEEYRRLRSELERAVRRSCPSWLQSRRDDLVQAAMMKLLDALERGEGNHRPSPSYLYRVAYSAMVDEMRRAQWRREVPLENGEGNGDPAAVRQPTPEQAVAAAEIAEGVHSCLGRLVEDRRLAVTLHLQGYTVPEAAATLDWAEKRTENLIYRGLADLRRCLLAKGLSP